jgi:hypothetical protein
MDGGANDAAVAAGAWVTQFGRSAVGAARSNFTAGASAGVDQTCGLELRKCLFMIALSLRCVAHFAIPFQPMYLKGVDDCGGRTGHNTRCIDVIDPQQQTSSMGARIQGGGHCGNERSEMQWARRRGRESAYVSIGHRLQDVIQNKG